MPVASDDFGNSPSFGKIIIHDQKIKHNSDERVNKKKEMLQYEEDDRAAASDGRDLASSESESSNQGARMLGQFALPQSRLERYA